MQRFNPDDISRLIQARRSVFPPQYSGETVAREIIEQILENANWAPTHKLTEPWRFTVFTGAGLKTLATFMSELYKEETMKDGSFDETKYNGLKTKPMQASHIIAIGMKRDTRHRLPEIEEIESVACAVQNMFLTATAFGVGGYWGSGGITYFEKAKPFFNLEPEDKLLGFLYLGIPKSAPAPGRRKPISEKVRWVE